ncbi:hypothetical protein [Eikenella sp. NML96-A-049]|nr:hypothetical protein [Eikenella sp. NML96-A-049]
MQTKLFRLTVLNTRFFSGFAAAKTTSAASKYVANSRTGNHLHHR